MFKFKEIIKNKIYILEVLLLNLLSLTPLLWFSPKHMLIGFDSGYPIDFIGYFHQRTFTWLSSQNFGTDMSSQMGQMPLHGLQAIVSYLGVDMYDVQKFTLIFWFLLIVFSMYCLISYLYPHYKYWLIRLSAVILYSFNLYIYSFWLQGSQTTFSAYVLLPLVVLILIKFFRNQLSSFKAALFLAIAVFFFNAGGVYGISVLGSTIVSAITVCLCYIFFFREKKLLYVLKHFLLLFLYFLVIAIPLNAYLLLPFLSFFGQLYTDNFTAAGGVNGVTGWASFISEHTSFINLFRLQGDLNWYNHPNFYSNIYLQNPIFIIASFVFPILAFSGHFFVKNTNEKRIILLFMMISFVGIFLAAGLHEPFGWIYKFLLEKLPGFAAFRSPYYKFIPVVLFSFSVLFAITLYYFLEKIKYTKARLLLGILAIMLLFGYHYPFFDKNNFIFNKPFSTMISMPEYVLNFERFEKKLPNEYKTLVLPSVNSGFPIKAYTWSYWSLSPFFTGLTNKSFVMQDVALTPKENQIVTEMYKIIRDKDIKGFLNISKKMNVKYLLLTEDIAHGYHTAPTEDPRYYKDILDNNPEAFDLVWREGPWRLYQIKWEIHKKIYTVDSIDLYTGLENTSYKMASKIENDFILEQDLQGNGREKLLQSIPFSYYVHSIECISCYNPSDYDDELNHITPNILPGSFLYKFKQTYKLLKRDQEQDKEKSLDQYLSSTLQHAAEIAALENREEKDISKDEWIKSVQALSSNWREINISMKDRLSSFDNFNSLYHIRAYAQSEKKILLKVYNSLFLGRDDALMQELEKSIWEIGLVDSLLEKIINKYDWERFFMYDIKDPKRGVIKLSLDDLPRDDKNKQVMPNVYVIDNSLNVSPIRMDPEGGIIIDEDMDRSKLLLEFSEYPNLYTEGRVRTIAFPNKKENCLYSSIPHYLWSNHYIVKGEFAGDKKDLNIYIKSEKGTFLTQDAKRINNDYFHSDKTYPFEENTENTFSYEFQGSQNDKKASVYFCSNDNSDPEKIFNSIIIKEYKKPMVYSVEKISSTEIDKPSILFKQINPTKYEVSVIGAKNSYILGFLERYSSKWKISFKDNDRNSNVEHFMLNSFSNGWLIDRKGDYQMTIEFFPQKLFELGSIISLITLVLIFGYLILDKAGFLKKK